MAPDTNHFKVDTREPVLCVITCVLPEQRVVCNIKVGVIIIITHVIIIIITSFTKVTFRLMKYKYNLTSNRLQLTQIYGNNERYTSRLLDRTHGSYKQMYFKFLKQ